MLYSYHWFGRPNRNFNSRCDLQSAGTRWLDGHVVLLPEWRELRILQCNIVVEADITSIRYFETAQVERCVLELKIDSNLFLVGVKREREGARGREGERERESLRNYE